MFCWRAVSPTTSTVTGMPIKILVSFMVSVFSLRKCVAKRFYECLACQCGAGNDINPGALRPDSFRGQKRHRPSVDFNGFFPVAGMVQKLDAGDLSVPDDGACLNVTVVSIGD